MTKKSKESKYIPTKNYVYVALLALLAIGITWYFLSWLKVKKQETLLDSYLVSTNTLSLEIQNLQEVKQVLRESPTEYFIYISYTNDEQILNLEKKLKKIIDNYELNDQFYYVNVTKDLDKESLYSNLNDAFSTTLIKNVPCILYYKNDVLEDVIVKDDGIFSHKSLENLLKENEYES